MHHIRTLLTAPRYADDEQAAIARIAYTLLVIIISVTVLYNMIAPFVVSHAPAYSLIAVPLCAYTLHLLRRGHLLLVGRLLTTGLALVLALGALLSGFGLDAPALTAYVFVIILGSLLVDSRTGLAAALAGIALSTVVWALQSGELLAIHQGPSPAITWFIQVFTFAVTALLVAPTMDLLRRTRARALGEVTRREEVERQLRANERILQASQVDLERQVAERTAELQAEREMLATRVAEQTAELRAANSELERALHVKDTFLASMSHELRTPLNAILGISEALQLGVYGDLTERQVASAHTIEASGRHLLALINDILDLAKIEAGQMTISQEPVPVADLCRSSIKMVEAAAKHKGLELMLWVEPGVATVAGDERRLTQILVNLLSNAVKFTSSGVVGLEVTVDALAGEIHFTVADTGIGIAPEDQARLFRPFVQLDSRLARRYEGTGLGLALVSQLTALHGGRVVLESTVSRGSRFTVTLPWQPDVGAQLALTSLD
ncbi:MAG: hypothetical protein RLZZ387_1474 [Chloroflexota bacterium]